MVLIDSCRIADKRLSPMGIELLGELRARWAEKAWTDVKRVLGRYFVPSTLKRAVRNIGSWALSCRMSRNTAKNHKHQYHLSSTNISRLARVARLMIGLARTKSIDAGILLQRQHASAPSKRFHNLQVSPSTFPLRTLLPIDPFTSLAVD